MQTYRATPAPMPLLSLVEGRLVAIDATTGHLRWERPVREPLDRVLVAGGNVFLATARDPAGHVALFDLATGSERGGIDLTFRAAAALATADRVYLSGHHGLDCLTHEGALVFRAGREITRKSAWSGDTIDLVGMDAQDRELWRIADAKAHTTTSFLALGHLIAQIDSDS